MSARNVRDKVGGARSSRPVSHRGDVIASQGRTIMSRRDDSPDDGQHMLVISILLAGSVALAHNSGSLKHQDDHPKPSVAASVQSSCAPIARRAGLVTGWWIVPGSAGGCMSSDVHNPCADAPHASAGAATCVAPQQDSPACESGSGRDFASRQGDAACVQQAMTTPAVTRLVYSSR